jgi:hypothetical protein
MLTPGISLYIYGRCAEIDLKENRVWRDLQGDEFQSPCTSTSREQLVGEALGKELVQKH